MKLIFAAISSGAGALAAYLLACRRDEQHKINDYLTLLLMIHENNQISEFAKNSFGILLASFGLSLIIKQLKSFENSIEIFDAGIAKIYDSFDCQLHTIIFF